MPLSAAFLADSATHQGSGVLFKPEVINVETRMKNYLQASVSGGVIMALNTMGTAVTATTLPVFLEAGVIHAFPIAATPLAFDPTSLHRWRA